MEKEQPTVSRIKYKYLKYMHKYPLYTDNDSIIVNIFHEKDTNARYTHYTGIANPIPLFPPPFEIMAVFIPINAPRLSTNAPPEFPGFIEASV